MNREELKGLLSGKFPVLKDREIYVWGTGNTAQLYQEGLKRIEEEIVISGYGDNKHKKWGEHFGGKLILSPEEIAKIPHVFVLICTPQRSVWLSVKKQLDQMGIENALIDEVIFKLHKEDILAVYDCLGSEKSKEIYAELIAARMSNKLVREAYICGNQYFALPEFLQTNPREVFVDCGGYVGDTIEQYLWLRAGSFKRVISFEPDEKNYRAMQYRAERLRREWNLQETDLILHHAAVGEKSDMAGVFAYDENHGLGSKLLIGEDSEQNGIKQCRIISIDDCIHEEFALLKADIESYEYVMLLGARNSITAYRPKLAICIYHNAIDFYSIPLLLKQMVPEYRLEVRHHSAELSDTVLYAYIEEKI